MAEGREYMSDILSMFRLDGKVALVTGASRGIGLGLAEALAQAGADVALVSRSHDQFMANAERIAAQTGRSALALEADLADREAIRRWGRQALECLGRLAG